GNCHHQELIAGRPRHLAHGLRERQHGVQRVKNEPQRTECGPYGDAETQKYQQQNECGCNHHASPFTRRRPISASSRASSSVPRTPQVAFTVARSPVTRAMVERSSMSASTTRSHTRPATHRYWRIDNGLGRVVLAVDWFAHDRPATVAA